MNKKESLTERFLKKKPSPAAVWAVKRDFDLRDRVAALIDREPSRAAAADKLGVARSLITEWLSGKRKLTLRTLGKIEEAYNVQLWDVAARTKIERVAISDDLRRFSKQYTEADSLLNDEKVKFTPAESTI